MNQLAMHPSARTFAEMNCALSGVRTCGDHEAPEFLHSVVDFADDRLRVVLLLSSFLPKEHMIRH